MNIILYIWPHKFLKCIKESHNDEINACSNFSTDKGQDLNYAIRLSAKNILKQLRDVEENFIELELIILEKKLFLENGEVKIDKQPFRRYFREFEKRSNKIIDDFKDIKNDAIKNCYKYMITNEELNDCSKPEGADSIDERRKQLELFVDGILKIIENRMNT